MSLVKDLLQKVKRVRFSVILHDIVCCFLYACLMVFFVLFFEENPSAYTKTDMQNDVLEIFILFIVLLILYRLLFSRNSWYYSYAGSASELFVPGTARLEPELTGEMRKLHAVHESGHALMSCLKKIPFSHVDLSCVYNTLSDPCSATQVRDMIFVFYAGAAAEEILLGKLSTGCMGDEAADLTRATQSLKWYLVLSDPEVSKTMLDAELSEKMIALSKEFYKETKELLADNLEALNTLSIQLYEKGKLTREEIEKLLQEIQKLLQ